MIDAVNLMQSASKQVLQRQGGLPIRFVTRSIDVMQLGSRQPIRPALGKLRFQPRFKRRRRRSAANRNPAVQEARLPRLQRSPLHSSRKSPRRSTSLRGQLCARIQELRKIGRNACTPSKKPSAPIPSSATGHPIGASQTLEEDGDRHHQAPRVAGKSDEKCFAAVVLGWISIKEHVLGESLTPEALRRVV